MEASNVVALVVGSMSLAISGIALRYARVSAKTGQRSAAAAESSAEQSRRSADAAEQQVNLTLGRQAAEDERQSARELGEARLVTMQISYMGALEVTITNGGSRPIRGLNIEEVRSDGRPELQWRVIGTVYGAQSSWEVVDGSEEVTCPVEFTDQNDGSVVRFAGERFVVPYSFTDADGQRWRNAGDGPERINLDT